MKQVRWRAAAVVAAILLGLSVARAQEMQGEILDLIYPVENLAGQAQNLAVKETATETRIELPADILFDFDKSDIRASAADALKQVAGILRERAKGRVVIEGHTDPKGNHPYNQGLSERRAGSVEKWLVDREGSRADEIRGPGLRRDAASRSQHETR